MKYRYHLINPLFEAYALHNNVGNAYPFFITRRKKSDQETLFQETKMAFRNWKPKCKIFSKVPKLNDREKPAENLLSKSSSQTVKMFHLCFSHLPTSFNIFIKEKMCCLISFFSTSSNGFFQSLNDVSQVSVF